MPSPQATLQIIGVVLTFSIFFPSLSAISLHHTHINGDLSLNPFPLESVVSSALLAAESAAPINPSGVKRHTYLDVLAPVVLHFRQFQNKDPFSIQYGRIIDPYAGMEIQYSTPTFAFAGATLIKNQYFNASLTAALTNDVALAMTAALTALSFGQPEGEQGCAQGHCNFYTMPLMLALSALNGSVSEDQMQKWVNLTQSIDPTKAYKGWPGGIGNWAIVALTGEFLRYQLGLRDGIADIVEQLANQYTPDIWTDNGEYQDHSGCSGACNPMPYDHFPRKYMTVMLDYGYNASNATLYWELNRRAAWVSLLLQSPWGELPTGGRSSQHQWNEAVSCVTYEYWASKYYNEGNYTAAGVFKRAAALSLKSLMRWKRPTGEWFIVKNKFDPELRHGYESYSYYSQYNLLPASMLATAYLFADDAVQEIASFAETGGFTFQPANFHKVISNVGGMYVETELYADAPPHDSTGLTRIHHRAADPLITITAGAPPDMEGAPPNKDSLAPGAAWYIQEEVEVNATVYMESNSYDPSRFRVSNILWSDNPTDDQSKLWLLPYNTSGGFILDLLGAAGVAAVTLVNTHNSHYNDFGTKGFSVALSNSSSGPWMTVVEDTLPNVDGGGTVAPVTYKFSPTPSRFVKFWASSFYAKGAGLNSFSLEGVHPHYVTKNITYSLAGLSFLDMASTSLSVQSSSTSLAEYSIDYSFQDSKSPVSQLTEAYRVTPNNVTVTATVPADAEISGMMVRIPLFVTDGTRNTTWFLDESNALVVRLPGDEVSQLNTTCSRFSVDGVSSWQLDSMPYYARNGYMYAAEAYIGNQKARSVTFTITPLNVCPSD
eukprot:m.27809 g.27809  ORF g.27809 m.27809 type:complete len:831 (-) comp10335_c0_seq2:88-2580(-)